MAIATHSARIVGPVSYTAAPGSVKQVPLGPCLLETLDGLTIDLIWGASGQNCATLPATDMASALDQGNLVLLD